jgi:hypothetical protein
MTRVTQSSQHHQILESKSSPSLQQNVTRVDSSPSFDSDSPIPAIDMMHQFKIQVRRAYQT